LPAIAKRVGRTRNTDPESVKHYFHPAGDSELVEDAEQIIFHSVFSELETMSDFAVSKPLHKTSNHIGFTCGKQRSIRCFQRSKSGLSQGFEEILKFGAARPDLSLVHAWNAFSKEADRL